MWWEKTVEYLFVINNLKRDMLMAPLDGNYEAASDLVAGINDRWVLIEFKRDAKAIDAEIRKFAEPSEISFRKAKVALGGSDGHHLIVFGEPDPVEKLRLNATSYFRKSSVEPKDVLDRGINKDNFNSYLKAFLYFKFGEAEEASGGRSLDYSSVLAVGANGKVTHCEGLQSYCEGMDLGPKLTQTQSPAPRHEPSGFSPR